MLCRVPLSSSQFTWVLVKYFEIHWQLVSWYPQLLVSFLMPFNPLFCVALLDWNRIVSYLKCLIMWHKQQMKYVAKWESAITADSCFFFFSCLCTTLKSSSLFVVTTHPKIKGFTAYLPTHLICLFPGR